MTLALFSGKGPASGHFEDKSTGGGGDYLAVATGCPLQPEVSRIDVCYLKCIVYHGKTIGFT